MKTVKNILKWFFISLTILTAGIFIYAYIAFNSFSFDDSSFAVDPSAAPYFYDSYEDCRKSFREQAKQITKTYRNALVTSFTINSQKDNDLTTDILYIPAQKKKDKLVIFSAGVHGVEGFVGSAVEQMFLKEMLHGIDLSRTGFLLIHAVNPYGMKYFRRVTENNVDMNRNSDVTRVLFSTQNEGYGELNHFLNPTEKLNTGSLENRFFLITAIRQLLTSSIQVLRQAIVQGQYKYEKGIYYGGNDFEPQIRALSPYLKKTAAAYKHILHMDIHTGYGERGILHLFPNPIKDLRKKSMLQEVFRGYRIDWGDSDDFYTLTGDFSELTGKLLPEKIFLPMTLEYGTMNSQTTVGSIKSLHIMILENQGIHHGYESDEDREEISRLFREMYFPASGAWRSEIIRISRKLIPGAIKRFQNIK